MKHSSKKETKLSSLSVIDHLVTGEKFQLLEDKTRDLLLTFPQPNTADLPKYYESEEYISHSDSSKGIINFLYQVVKKYSLSKKVQLIKQLNGERGTLLDVGCGTGEFLLKAKENNWIVSGVEPNESARELSLKKKINTYTELNEVGDTRFDVVTLWHVLEHLPNLEEAINEIELKVKSGGHLVIAVPNYKSYDAKYYKEFWAAYDVPRHLSHFSQNSFNHLLSDKFKLVGKKPMWFDSFYVSLLSEKYKTGRKFSVRAFFVGFYSNLKGIFTSEYSSIIYSFKKQNKAISAEIIALPPENTAIHQKPFSNRLKSSPNQ